MRVALIVVVGCGSSVVVPASGSGGVTLTTTNAVDQQGGTANAYFADPITIPCATTRMSVAGCLVSTGCDESSLPMVPTYNPGLVVVEGTTPTVMLNSSAYLQFPAPLFGGGETLTFSGEGAELDPFTGSLVAPSQIIVSGPATPPAPGSDVPITWTGDSAGQVVVSKVAGTQTSSTFVDCSFPAADGHATLPAAAWSLADGGNVDVNTTTSMTTMAGGWTVGLDAWFEAVQQDGTNASGVDLF